MLTRTTPMKRSRMNRGPSKKQRRKQSAWNAITRRKIEAGVGCEARCSPECVPWAADQGHHKLPKRFGDWSEGNHLLVDMACHEWIGSHRDKAVALGLLIRGNSRPVRKGGAE